MRKEDLNIVPLARASVKELGELRKKVEENGGTVPVLVHPFFTRRPNVLTGQGQFTPSKEYSDIRDQFLTECLLGGIPLIIFEEYGRVEEQLPQQIPAPGTIYLVETSREYPTYKYGLEREVYDKFEEVRIKHVLIGGCLLRIYVASPDPEKRNVALVPSGRRTHGSAQQELSYMRKLLPHNAHARRWIDSNIYPGGCVRGVIDRLIERGIDVTLTTIHDHDQNRQ